jgi:acyl-coenzyme A synthetase/AMP-(fatty) acid ligase
VTWRFVDGFPLTPSGKIKKFELRRQDAPLERSPAADAETTDQPAPGKTGSMG